MKNKMKKNPCLVKLAVSCEKKFGETDEAKKCFWEDAKSCKKEKMEETETFLV